MNTSCDRCVIHCPEYSGAEASPPGRPHSPRQPAVSSFVAYDELRGHRRVSSRVGRTGPLSSHYVLYFVPGDARCSENAVLVLSSTVGVIR